MQDFDNLFNLASAVSQHRLVKDIPFSSSNKPRSKLEQFYQGILKGEFNTDEDAAAKLYKSIPSNSAYKRLKERLGKKLIQHLFLIDFEKNIFSNESRTYFEGLITVLATKILLGLGHNSVALPIAKKGIKSAVDHRYSEIGLLLSSSYQVFLKHFEKNENNRQIKQIAKITPSFFLKSLLSEIEIEENYEKILKNIIKGGIPDQMEISESYKNLLLFKAQKKNLGNLSLIKLYYALAAASIFYKKYKEAISLCNEGLEMLKKSKIASIHIICLLKAQCYLHLNQFKKTKDSIQEADDRRTRPDLSWAGFFEIKFILAARSGQFHELSDLYYKAISDPKLNLRPILAQESWRQYGLLLLFLIKLDKIPPSESLDRIKPKLRAGKLMNEMPEYSKDKAGQNLAIRILHVLILLVSKRFEEFEEALPPLQSYIDRYKRRYPELFRSDLLVKMLSNIPKVGYNAERAAWRAKPLLDKMIVPPEQLPLKITEMEVIPYEKMWHFVEEFLGSLKRRPQAHKPRKP